MTPEDIFEIHKDTFQPRFFTIAGSRLIGMHTDDSDYDYMGVSVEPPSHMLALKTFEQHEWKRSDLNAEGVTYSLRKFVSLLTQGNPTILCTAFSSQAQDDLGLTDPEFRNLWASRRAAARFIGYMTDQMNRLHTTTGMHVTRAHLIDKFGYDTKYAAHVIRLGLQGIEYLATGKLTLPMDSHHIASILKVRNGELTYDQFKARAENTLAALRDVEGLSKLPENPQTNKINDWLTSTYLKEWKRCGYID